MATETLMLESLPDRELVILFQKGEMAACEQLFRRHRDRVFFTCQRYLPNQEDAEEAIQETFLKAYMALNRFNGRYLVGPWLTRIAANVCLDQLRAKTRTSNVVTLPPP